MASPESLPRSPPGGRPRRAHRPARVPDAEEERGSKEAPAPPETPPDAAGTDVRPGLGRGGEVRPSLQRVPGTRRRTAPDAGGVREKRRSLQPAERPGRNRRPARGGRRGPRRPRPRRRPRRPREATPLADGFHYLDAWFALLGPAREGDESPAALGRIPDFDERRGSLSYLLQRTDRSVAAGTDLPFEAYVRAQGLDLLDCVILLALLRAAHDPQARGGLRLVRLLRALGVCTLGRQWEVLSRVETAGRPRPPNDCSDRSRDSGPSRASASGGPRGTRRSPRKRNRTRRGGRACRGDAADSGLQAVPGARPGAGRVHLDLDVSGSVERLLGRLHAAVRTLGAPSGATSTSSRPSSSTSRGATSRETSARRREERASFRSRGIPASTGCAAP